jgi:hypothetical protein
VQVLLPWKATLPRCFRPWARIVQLRTTKLEHKSRQRVPIALPNSRWRVRSSGALFSQLRKDKSAARPGSLLYAPSPDQLMSKTLKFRK